MMFVLTGALTFSQWSSGFDEDIEYLLISADKPSTEYEFGKSKERWRQRHGWQNVRRGK